MKVHIPGMNTSTAPICPICDKPSAKDDAVVYDGFHVVNGEVVKQGSIYHERCFSDSARNPLTRHERTKRE